MRPSILALVAALLAAPAAHAEFLRFDLALTFNRFEQQVKS